MKASLGLRTCSVPKVSHLIADQTNLDLSRGREGGEGGERRECTHMELAHDW